MDAQLFVMLMENRSPLNKDVIQRHVGHLKTLEADGKLVLCGPFSDFAGGMVVVNVPTRAEACEIFESDPYVAEGYKAYQLRTLEVANRENGYLLG